MSGNTPFSSDIINSQEEGNAKSRSSNSSNNTISSSEESSSSSKNTSKQHQPHDHPGKTSCTKNSSSNNNDNNNKRKKKSRPQCGPARPLSAYNLFFQHYRRLLLEAGGNVSFRTMGKEVGKKWKTLQETERQEWEQKAEQESMRYRKAKRAYEDEKREQRRLRTQNYLNHLSARGAAGGEAKTPDLVAAQDSSESLPTTTTTGIRLAASAPAPVPITTNHNGDDSNVETRGGGSAEQDVSGGVVFRPELFHPRITTVSCGENNNEDKNRDGTSTIHHQQAPNCSSLYNSSSMARDDDFNPLPLFPYTPAPSSSRAPAAGDHHHHHLHGSRGSSTAAPVLPQQQKAAAVELEDSTTIATPTTPALPTPFTTRARQVYEVPQGFAYRTGCHLRGPKYIYRMAPRENSSLVSWVGRYFRWPLVMRKHLWTNSRNEEDAPPGMTVVVAVNTSAAMG
ncbi:hypothetical protein ACA910_016743 [Epithemia clementina (nom. ined.)]